MFINNLSAYSSKDIFSYAVNAGYARADGAITDPRRLYDAAVQFGVTSAQLDQAFNMTPGTTDNWIASVGLPFLNGALHTVQLPVSRIPGMEAQIGDKIPFQVVGDCGQYSDVASPVYDRSGKLVCRYNDSINAGLNNGTVTRQAAITSANTAPVQSSSPVQASSQPVAPASSPVQSPISTITSGSSGIPPKPPLTALQTLAPNVGPAIPMSTTPVNQNVTGLLAYDTYAYPSLQADSAVSDTAPSGISPLMIGAGIVAAALLLKK